MFDPLSLGIAVGAAGAAVAIGYLQWPRPPDLDGERWFKTMLATLLRGELDASERTFEDWEVAVKAWVPYHPAGRFPERKVLNPLAARLPGALLEGERALLEGLTKLQTVPERWARMYDEDEAALASRLDDPLELGPDYDPTERLGAGAGWEELAAWGAGEGGFGERLSSRLEASWFLVEGRGGFTVIPELAKLLGDRAIRVPGGDEDLAKTIEDRLERVEARGILVGEEAGIVGILNALRDRADLRDKILAVVSVGGIIGGLEGEDGPLGIVAREDWMQAWFSHQHLDTEVVRITSYLSLQWLDRQHMPPGARGLSIAASRFPEPKEERTETVEVVDLGVLPAADDLPMAQVARALWAVTTCWVLSRR